MTPEVPPVSLGMLSLGFALGATIMLFFGVQKYWKFAIFGYVVAGLLGIAELIT